MLFQDLCIVIKISINHLILNTIKSQNQFIGEDFDFNNDSFDIYDELSNSDYEFSDEELKSINQDLDDQIINDLIDIDEIRITITSILRFI